MAKQDSRLERAGVSGYNKPKRTPNHPTNRMLLLLQGDKIKTIRFGEQEQRPQANLKLVSLINEKEMSIF